MGGRLMGKSSVHYDWLRLIEVSGPFLSAAVLDEAFPSGLDGLDKTAKRRLSHYYDEWLEAHETKSPVFAELHKAWCTAVLHEGLEFHDSDLEDAAGYAVKDEAGLGEFAADQVFKDDAGAPLFFIKMLPAAVKPHDRDTADGWKDTHVEKMTRLCRAHNVRVGLLTNGDQWVRVNAAPGGSLSGSATWHARLWFQEDGTLRAFIALLGSRRFLGAPAKRLARLLDESLQHLEEVTDTLGKQVMAAVEVLLEGFDRADLESGRTLLADVPPKVLYEASLTVMMRLIFLLCAEERGLLLLGEKIYDDVYAVSTLRNKLEKDSDRYGPQVLERRYDAWARLLGVFRAVFGGISHPELRLPAMGGSLFDPEKYPFLEGRRYRNGNGGYFDLGSDSCSIHSYPLPIDNRTVLHILESLQVLNHKNGAIQLSFRSLDVEQIGYIYEGLLEFTAKKAPGILLGLKGDKSHLNPEIALSELESLAMDSRDKLIARVKELTGRSALAREYSQPPDLELMPQLVKVCRGDDELKNRVLPFLNWLRLSAWGEPVVYHKDSFYVTEGVDRRSSGTHYTPKALTEMIVREALEPVVYDGPAKGLPRAEWKLKSPAEILELKVCDPAMGSGAFLVQACRYLGDRLVDSWEIEEKSGGAIESNGTVTKFPPNDPIGELADDRLCLARRLVVEKCLYGVDINPLAGELAKLSLWLVTISKGRPFGFLDHNLKSGDSLLGVSDIKQLIQFRMKPSNAPFGNLLITKIESAVAEALVEREAIRAGRSRDIKDVALLQQHYRKSEELTRRIKEYADFFIGEVLVAGKPGKKTDAKLDAAAMEGADLIDGDSLNVVYLHNRTKANLAYDLPAGQTAPRRPFHWAIEFPEVFSTSRACSSATTFGFDAIVGNPPFLGGQRLTGNFGVGYRDYIVNYIANGIKGSADLVVYFFLRAYVLLKADGVFSLIACNTIAQGDTRQVGLERLVEGGAIIVSTNPEMPWPGTAAVVISPVTIIKTKYWRGVKRINGAEVEYISPFLTAQNEWTPMRLAANHDKSFIGSYILGMGFTMSEEEAKILIEKDHKNRDVLFPYLNGIDLNSNVGQKASRWVINFFDWPCTRDHCGSWDDMSEQERTDCFRKGSVPIDYPGPVAADYPLILEIVNRLVRPDREKQNRECRKQYWWHYAEKTPALYHAIGWGEKYARHPKGWIKSACKPMSVWGTALSSKHRTFYNYGNVGVIDQTNVSVVCPDVEVPVLLSTIHSVWGWKNGATLGTSTSRYTPSDCYETFPFPAPFANHIDYQLYCSLRDSIMTVDQIGLTQLYNKFHDPSVDDSRFVELRKLQREIDEAVRDAYGWSDIDLGHGFHEVGYLPTTDNVRYTISESARIEILKRLAKLNKERWEEEEKAGLHKKKGKK